MKNLLLVRHAKAQEKREFDYDLSRHLLKKGLKDAKKMADKIKGRVSGKVLFITSDANRTFETAHVFAQKLDYPTTRILLKSIIYHDPKPEKFLELIQETDDSYDTVILFGHNPSLSEFASSLIKDFEFDIPKCGVAAFTFDNNSWKEIEQASGILKFAEYPVIKSEAVSAFENTLIVKITESILDALENINPDAAKNVLKSIAKHSAKLAGNFTDTLKRNKADKKPDCKAKADKKTDHKKDDKHKKDEKADIELDNKPDIKIDEQANIEIEAKADIKVDEKVESESIKKSDSKEKSGKKGWHKHHKKSGHNKTDEKTDHESDVLADWDTDDKNNSETADTNSETSSKIDKKDDWGIDGPSTNQ